MVNIDLELVSDVNLDQALCVLARTLAAGRRSHRAGVWRLKPVQNHLNHARKHLDLLASGSGGEDHLAHAACRLLMALELRERRAQTRAAGPRSAEAATDSDQMPLFAGEPREQMKLATPAAGSGRTSKTDRHLTLRRPPLPLVL